MQIYTHTFVHTYLYTHLWIYTHRLSVYIYKYLFVFICTYMHFFALNIFKYKKCYTKYWDLICTHLQFHFLMNIPEKTIIMNSMCIFLVSDFIFLPDLNILRDNTYRIFTSMLLYLQKINGILLLTCLYLKLYFFYLWN